MKKLILINNQFDLSKFYRLIPLYRSILYRFTKFELIKDDLYELTPLINALNIKNRRRRIIYVYDYACSQVDDYYKNTNMCEFKNNQCINHREINNGKFNGCCRICKYKNSGPCPTHNLSCKLFYCSAAAKKRSLINFDELTILKCLTKRQQILLKSNYFCNREAIINDLYIGSLLVGIIRRFFRLCFNLVIVYFSNYKKK